MTREDKRAYNYARDRLANDDYPVYSDEYELELAYKAGIEDAKNHPHWISVEDELPPKYDSYLTRSSGNVIEITHYNIDGWHTESKGKVTHWMPLPSIEGTKGNQGETSPNEEGGEER